MKQSKVSQNFYQKQRTQNYDINTFDFYGYIDVPLRLKSSCFHGRQMYPKNYLFYLFIHIVNNKKIIH